MEKMIQQLQLDQIKDELSSPWVQWGGLLCVIILFWWLIIDPYMQWRSSEWTSIKQHNLQLEKLERLANSQAEVATSSQAIIKASNQAEQLMIDTRTPSRAISTQVDWFDKIYRKHNLKFKGRRFGEPKLEPWLGEQVNASWRLTGTSDDIISFIYSLAASKRIIEPVSIDIKPSVTRTRPKSKKGGAQVPEYELAIDIRSYRILPFRELKAGGQ